jgi:acyl carrier protein
MKEFGVDLTATARRSLTNPVRLLLWLYEVKAVKQGHDDEIDARSEELSTLKIEALTNRLSEYESKALPEPLQKELAIELQGLLHAFTDSNLKFLIEVLEPAIKWHSDHDSQMLAQAFDAFYWHEPGRSWTLANEMLQHKDQRVVDFASQLLEQMEVAEEGGMPAEIIDRVRAIVVSLLGVDPIQVTPESQFYEDLEADSLDCVEMIMSVEEEFGIEISDEDAERLTTVGELVQYLTSVT